MKKTEHFAVGTTVRGAVSGEILSIDLTARSMTVLTSDGEEVTIYPYCLL